MHHTTETITTVDVLGDLPHEERLPAIAVSLQETAERIGSLAGHTIKLPRSSAWNWAAQRPQMSAGEVAAAEAAARVAAREKTS